MDLVTANLLNLLLLVVLFIYPALSFRSVFASLNSGSQIKATCGFPGSPKNGRVLHLLEKYEEDMVVTFECDTGYYLLGAMTRTCLSNGTWSGNMPVCGVQIDISKNTFYSAYLWGTYSNVYNQSMSNLGLTSASEALNNYAPNLAVDGNFRTCFFSNRRKPRWWRVELPAHTVRNQSIISVALTLPPINADLHFSIYVIEMENTNENHDTSGGNDTSTNHYTAGATKYHKCATFRGVFSSKSIVVQCARNAAKLKGSFLQIEDDHPQLEYFGLCEVDIFVEREFYECGQVEVPSNGYVLDKSSNLSKAVDYFCHEGYRLVGVASRTCDNKTGQWSQSEPFCERITCSPPSPIDNGFYRLYGDHSDVPVVGTRTVYECQPGFLLVGQNNTTTCDSSGEWSGSRPHCQAIDCGHPESLLLNAEEFILSGAEFRFLNGTTKYSAMTELVCPSQEVLRNNLTRSSLLFRCREDGIWTEVAVEASNANTSNKNMKTNSTSVDRTGTDSCVKQRHNGFLYFYGSNLKGSKLRKSFQLRDSSINMLYFLAAIVVAAFLSILVIVVLLFKRNIIEWPEYSCITCNDSFKSFGQSIKQTISNMFAHMNQAIHSVIGHKFGQRTRTDNQENPSFTIAPSTSDIEIARNSDEPSVTTEETKGELDSALATFYEEITNAAKQVFAEDTERKLMRAARIAAELDVIKTQQESNYHWIYASPPRHGTSQSLPPSLNPSVHESSQIGTSGQIYAKVDLIRKHRYRKDKEISSLYQVPPRPRHMQAIDSMSPISQENGSTVYQLRKAISSPDSVFHVVEGEYATIRQLRLDRTAKGSVANDETAIQAHQFNHIPIQTLL